MRQHRSPTGVLSYTVVHSPSSTNSHPSHSTSEYYSMRSSHSPAAVINKEATHHHSHDNNVISDTHGAHHSRKSSFSSVDLERSASKEALQKNANLGQYEVLATKAEQPTHQRQRSYSTSAYQAFLNTMHGSSSANSSAVSSAVSSAASSAVPSRQVSRANSLIVSGQASRSISPLSQKDDREERVVRDSHLHHKHPSQNASQYVETISFPNGTSASVTTTTTTTTTSTLSFNNLKLSKSESQESLDDGLVHHNSHQPRLKPNHFTFCQDDIMKSFMRAAERDRQRAERELERQREAQQRLEIERENERRRAMQAQHAMQAPYNLVSRADTVGADWSDSGEDEAVPHRRRRRGFPPVPAHFKFNTHDVAKSAAKPSQRQNIGHWTTFPKSSTVVITAEQLRSWIEATIAEQIAAERKQRLLQQQQQQQHRRQTSAPTSPTTRKIENESITARVQPRGTSAQRRASLPSQMVDVKPTVRANSARAGHTRSSTLDFASEKLHAFNATAMQGKSSARREGEKAMPIRKFSAVNGSLHTRVGSGESFSQAARGVYESSSNVGILSARRGSLPVKGVALPQVVLNQVQPQQQQTRVTTNGLGLNGHTASAPVSTNHSPTRSSTAMYGRVKSANVSPSRPAGSTRSIASVMQRSATLPQQRTPQPPPQRKLSISGPESKSASNHNSPVQQSTKLNDAALWSNQPLYEKTLQEVYNLNLAHGMPNNVSQPQKLASLYQHVPSSGYGQQRVIRQS